MKFLILQNSVYILALTAIVTLFSSVGCGGGESTGGAEPAAQSAPPRADLCALLTSADIEAALGTASGEPAPGDAGKGQCTWGTADGSGALVVLTLQRAGLDSFDEFVADFGEEFGGEDPPREEYHPVEGIPGDWAMYVAEEHMVRAFRGDDVLEVSSPSAPSVPSVEEAQIIDLATRAMANLP
jgi:hypothetical protein